MMNSYYSREDLKRIPEIMNLAPKAAASFIAFEKEIYTDSGSVPVKTKELIAIAVAHITGCPYCIDTHTQRYKKLGGTSEEIIEAVLVAASTRAGAVLSHATQALAAFDQGLTTDESSPVTPVTKPDCFC
ncbi:carboxymuconolactone decarboxylase family protein [Paenibacillus hexagrammi]|uniref:Carboxymuconolactone decarboxylase family protein n=1 Tax=Paenibacillus hexagrammi TaxID=2908839 RepID=A0ABY3SRE0_9BACL|nr:carboxymuconolactone decarboxylase family protein [Paenibacillus sp. YPD9-1]UJF36125.1 carboxymuconolactone decarboxylase family protein [Paenibacillus sp. YPD9-1]